jgi:ribosomal protein S18 acetylase RimI-like enzyme
MELRILNPDEWPLVEPTLRNVFRDGMPVTPRQATFLAALERGRLAGFIQVEQLLRIFHLYVAPGFRGAEVARLLADEAARDIPAGFSACVLTNERALIRWALRHGARDVGAVHFLRKDF